MQEMSRVNKTNLGKLRSADDPRLIEASGEEGYQLFELGVNVIAHKHTSLSFPHQTM